MSLSESGGSDPVDALSMPVINIATYGWEGEAWQGFYPADLPEDWRMDYYGNEFRAVVIPASVWQRITPAVVEEWLDAIHAEFQFYFERLDGQRLTPEQQAIVASFGQQMGGWICQTPTNIDDNMPSIWYEGEGEPRQMRTAIEQLHQRIGDGASGVMVVNANNVPWEVAADMRQLAELMGYG